MNAHYLQHVSFEGLGSIESWLDAAGYKITKTQFFKSANLPEPDQIDLLIVMGGPMNINEEDAFPWLARENQFIRDIIKSGKSYWVSVWAHSSLQVPWAQGCTETL